ARRVKFVFFFSSRRRHTRWPRDWSSDVCSSDLFNRSPGNLYSEVQKVHLDPAAGYKIKLSLTRAIPPIEVPPDTPWVKHIKIQRSEERRVGKEGRTRWSP